MHLVNSGGWLIPLSVTQIHGPLLTSVLPMISTLWNQPQGP